MEDTGFKGKTILIADDEEYVRHHISKRLASLDLKVLQAGSGEEVLDLVKEHPHLIIMDVRMPVLDGLETLRRLKDDEETAGIPVVLLSALGQQDGIRMDLAAGADEYVMKPITFERLLESIRHHLG